MKVLNLYAGIGGNRKLWTDVDVTAIENNPDIAKIYQDFFPDDKVIVADAHQYLLEHYKEFDFIWSSPPCQSHSRMNLINVSRGVNEPRYAKMELYQEIIFLNNWYKGKFVIENVVAYYKPLVRPAVVARHWFWSNFFLLKFDTKKKKLLVGNSKGNSVSIKEALRSVGMEVKDWHNVKNRGQIISNYVLPELGLHIFKSMNNQELKLAI